MKIILITSILLVTACAENPTMFAAAFDAGDTTRQNVDSFQASIDTDTGELEGLDTDTGELEGIDTDTGELEGLDTDTGELEGLDTDTGELEGIDTDTGELEGLDTDTGELEGLDTDTGELEGIDTDTGELEGLDTDTGELEGIDTDTGPTWVCDLNGEGCENWQQCVLDTISICPLSPNPIPISALNYGIDWLICKEDKCPTDLYHRECRDVNAIGTRCLP